VLAVGSRVGGYSVLAPLGTGGMGVVYKARDVATGEVVALKVIRADHARDDEFMRRFRLEARAAAAIDHPHVTALRASGEHEGQAFVAFEYLAGGSLDQRLREKGPLPWREACARGAEVAGAIAALHDKGLIHRDLKPENVLLDERGRSKLADFGLVRRDRTSGKWLTISASLTEMGQLVGTYEYMAPEQADGLKEIDARADLYGLGALLFALLTGRPPFVGQGVSVLMKIFQEPPPSPRKLAPATPARLERLVLALLEKDPARRPGTAREVERSLRELAAERVPRRILLPLILGAALGATVVAGVALTSSRWSVPAAAGRPPVVPSRAPSVDASTLLRSAAKKWDGNDFEGALADATKALEIAPDLARAWCVRGGVRQSMGDVDGAIADLTRAIELDPAYAEAWHRRGASRGAKGDADGQIEDETRAIELAPTAASWANRGAGRAAKGDLEGAIADTARAIELDPSSCLAWIARGTARGSSGDWDGEIADLTRAIELDPKVAAVWSNRGFARGKKGDWEGEIEDESRAIALQPTLERAWEHRGEARLERGDRAGAIADLERAATLEPHDHEARILALLERARSGDR
jgi:serine/threonine-protein kinase